MMMTVGGTVPTEVIPKGVQIVLLGAHCADSRVLLQLSGWRRGTDNHPPHIRWASVVDILDRAGLEEPLHGAVEIRLAVIVALFPRQLSEHAGRIISRFRVVRQGPFHAGELVEQAEKHILDVEPSKRRRARRNRNLRPDHAVSPTEFYFIVSGGVIRFFAVQNAGVRIAIVACLQCRRAKE